MRFLKADKFESDNFNFVPGPGSYERPNSKPARNIPRGSKPIPYTAFGQGSTRFAEKPVDLNIGPGQYFGISEWKAQPKKDTKPQLQLNTRKIVTIPSIPASTHAMGYVEREDGYLVPLNGAQIKEIEDMGPGAYHPVDQLTKKKVLGFSMEKGSVRFPAKKIENPTQAKTSIGLENVSNKQSDEREAMPKKIEKPKKAQTPDNPREPYVKETIIPIGHYYNEKLASSFKVQEKPVALQNFGSGAKRFIVTRDNSDQPGPGAYGIPKLDTSNNIYSIGRQEPFSKGDIRFRDGAEDLPGPGMYDPNFNLTPAGALSNATSSFAAAFGSGANRFIIPKVDMEQPGPGSYETMRKPKKKKRKGKLTVPPQYFSANNANHLSDPTRRLDLDLGGRTKGAVTVKHEFKPLGSSAFNPTVPRFKDQMAQDEVPGPGTYYSNSRNELIKPSFKSSKENFSLAARDNSKLEPYKAIVGPGSYESNFNSVKTNTNFIPKINPVSPFADITLAR